MIVMKVYPLLLGDTSDLHHAHLGLSFRLEGLSRSHRMTVMIVMKVYPLLLGDTSDLHLHHPPTHHPVTPPTHPPRPTFYLSDSLSFPL